MRPASHVQHTSSGRGFGGVGRYLLRCVACLAAAGVNIADLLNKSRGEFAYTLIDADGGINAGTLAQIRAIHGVLSARLV